jgi:hypothetical protein
VDFIVFARRHDSRNHEPSNDDLRLGRRRRHVAAQTLRKAANLVIGALVVGQFIRQAPISGLLLLAGAAGWTIGDDRGALHKRGRQCVTW